jgi:hypothetical protein
MPRLIPPADYPEAIHVDDFGDNEGRPETHARGSYFRFGPLPGLFDEAESSFDLAQQQQGAGFGGEPSAAEVGDDGLAAKAGEAEQLGGTVCHGNGLAPGGLGRVLTQTLQE